MTPSEAERLEALREYQILDTPREAAFDRITALAADLFDAPIALVSLVDADRQWFKSAVGLDVPETPREYAFCDHTIRTDEVFVVTDAEQDARFSANPLVQGDPRIRFYAGAPLRLRNGLKLGSLCIIDRWPRPELSENDKRRLQTLAQIVVNEMELRLTSERLELARRAAEAASAAKSEFLANMSHEVRTPLTSIIGFAGILGASASLGEREHRFVERIATASGNLLTIVNDVLDLARLESGELEVYVEPLDLLPVVEGAVEIMGEQAKAKGLALDVTAEGELPRTLVDAARLRQVVLNLVSNAVKFTDRGKIVVALRRAGDRLEVSVADTGIGIAPDRIAQIFDRFVQADSTIARRYGGTGLGLAISHRLVQRMGGTISAESRPGEGSTFILSLPAA